MERKQSQRIRQTLDEARFTDFDILNRYKGKEVAMSLRCVSSGVYVGTLSEVGTQFLCLTDVTSYRGPIENLLDPYRNQGKISDRVISTSEIEQMVLFENLKKQAGLD